MTDPDRPNPIERGPSVMRDVLVILLLGAGLGIASNQMQLMAGSSKALAWIQAPKTLAKLEDLPVAAVPAGSAAEDSTVSPPAPAPALDAEVPARVAPPVTRETAPPPAPAPSAPGVAAPTGPPSAASPAPATPRPVAPAIPDTREPLEAGYATIKALADANAVLFVDARSAEEYAEEHIPGAVNLPFDDVFQKPELAASLDARGRVLVAYCGGGDCELSKSLAFALIEGGHKKVLVFMAGLPGWKSQGNPVSRGAQP